MSSLLVNLRSYRPRDGRDSLENFITEAFRWIISKTPPLEKEILSLVKEKIGHEESIELGEQEMGWHTQFGLGSKRPDMVADNENALLIFEHKIWSDSNERQIQTYKDLAEKHYPFRQNAVILIVPSSGGFQQTADACLCWHEIYTKMETILGTNDLSEVEEAYISDFLELMDHEGIGPPAPVSQIALRYFSDTAELPNNLSRLYAQITHEPWTRELPGYDIVEKGSKWGRVGFYLHRNNSPLKWSPAIAVCTLLDGRDHCQKERVLLEPLKLQIIFSFSPHLHNTYAALPEYKVFTEFLENYATKNGANFYNHLEDRKTKCKNKYHPLCIEWPLKEILKNTKTLEDQVNAAREKIKPLISEAISSESFRNLTIALDETRTKKYNQPRDA